MSANVCMRVCAFVCVFVCVCVRSRVWCEQFNQCGRGIAGSTNRFALQFLAA